MDETDGNSEREASGWCSMLIFRNSQSFRCLSGSADLAYYLLNVNCLHAYMYLCSVI